MSRADRWFRRQKRKEQKTPVSPKTKLRGRSMGEPRRINWTAKLRGRLVRAIGGQT